MDGRLVVIIFLAALRNVPQDLYDSGKVDGANGWQQTVYLTVPMISGSIFFVVVVNTIAAFQTFSEAYTAFFGSGNTTYSNDAALFYVIYLFQQAFQFLHMGYASAMAWLLFVIIMIITCSVIFIYPFLWLLSASLKPRSDVFDNLLIPQTTTLHNYVTVWQQAPMALWLLNTLLVTVLAAGTVAITSAMVAWGLRTSGSRCAVRCSAWCWQR